ncbi:DUF6233 domain-containing protein [Streptomyces sp. NPDC007088]|uniref:DUF6233 domain-containing protein n=1 Tax=Streptomyces sp. NPDC007088 TaxID=3364773 RepID=UPI0036A946FE
MAATEPRVGYLVEQQSGHQGAGPAMIHLTDCPTVGKALPRVRADEARAALTDPGFGSCPRCRPDSELGIDVA